MRFRLTSIINGETIADENFSVDHGDFTYGVLVDGNSKATHLYVEISLDDLEKLPTFKKSKGLTDYSIEYHKPSKYDQMLEKLVYFESVGSFWWGIKSLGLREVKEEWIPENDADRKKANVLKLSSKNEYRKEPRPIKDHMITALLDLEDDEKMMVVPLSFYREGSSNFEDHKYIVAFQNYFLMIEGLFGKGKSGTNQLVNAFSSSKELKTAIDAMLEKIQEDKQHAHYIRLSEQIDELNRSVDVDGVLYWLVSTRGALMHFSLNSTRKQGTPLSNDEYRTHAYVIGGICTLVYVNFHNNILKERGYS